MATYLITGCAGFIGSAVAERLLAQGHAVVGVDNFSDYYAPRLKHIRAERLAQEPSFRLLHGDVADAGSLDAVFRHGSVDAVLHLAALPGVRSSVHTPGPYYRTNTAGTLELLECCRRYGVNKFILASTSAVYGNGALPFREPDATDNVLSPYAASKKAAEALCRTYHHLYGIDVGILRYFSVYGPAGRPDMIIPLFLRALLAGHPVTLLGDGRQKRDFTFIDDVVDGTLRALRPLGCECLNIGSGHTSELLDVLRLLELYTGRQADIRHAPAHPADVRETLSDSSRARDVLGWQPTVDLGDGLRRTVGWYCDHPDFL